MDCKFTEKREKEEILLYGCTLRFFALLYSCFTVPLWYFIYFLLDLFVQFILEQLCNLICPSKPEPVYLLVLNKAHTQEEFIRGSMTKNPYSSAEIGPLMRDVKNKICHQLDLLGLVEDDYGMELLVAGNIISLDLSIALVYEQVWKKSNHSSNVLSNSTLLSSNATPGRDCPPMNVTYRLQVCQLRRLNNLVLEHSNIRFTSH